MWQVFSGITHARQYAMMTILDKEELGFDAETGAVNVHLTTGAKSLAGSLIVAMDVVDTAVRLYGQRARSFTKLPADTVLAGLLHIQEKGTLQSAE